MRTHLNKKILAMLLVMLFVLATVSTALAVGNSTTLARKGDRYLVFCRRLNVRRGPGTNHSIRTSIRKNTVVTFQKSVKGWWYVRLSNGTYGYVDKQYLTPRHVPKPDSYRTTAALRLRALPNTSSTTLRTIPRRTWIYIEWVNGDWGKTTYNGKTGWVALKYVR